MCQVTSKNLDTPHSPRCYVCTSVTASQMADDVLDMTQVYFIEAGSEIMCEREERKKSWIDFRIFRTATNVVNTDN